MAICVRTQNGPHVSKTGVVSTVQERYFFVYLQVALYGLEPVFRMLHSSEMKVVLTVQKWHFVCAHKTVHTVWKRCFVCAHKTVQKELRASSSYTAHMYFRKLCISFCLSLLFVTLQMGPLLIYTSSGTCRILITTLYTCLCIPFASFPTCPLVDTV